MLITIYCNIIENQLFIFILNIINNRKILVILAFLISNSIYSENFVVSRSEKKEKIEKLNKFI